MTAPPEFLASFLGGRAKKPAVANIADGTSRASRAISHRMFDALGLLHDPVHPSGYRVAPVEGQSAGSALEQQVRLHLETNLPVVAPHRRWIVDQPGLALSSFEQYEHIATLQAIIDADKTNTLAVAIGRDYQVKPDVTVGEVVGPRPRKPLLHASVSCKLTLRSDRAQNVRLEAAILTRHRRGRQPHIVAVTAEPLPTRLTSLARGTGDLDALYHVALPELTAAVSAVGGPLQVAALDEIVGQRRLLDFDDLVPNLAV